MNIGAGIWRAAEMRGTISTSGGFGLIHFPFSSPAPVPTRKLMWSSRLKVPAPEASSEGLLLTKLLVKIFLKIMVDIYPIISYLYY